MKPWSPAFVFVGGSDQQPKPQHLLLLCFEALERGDGVGVGGSDA